MTAWLLALLATAALGLLTRELWGWLPLLSRFIIWLGTAPLPRDRKAVLREQWASDLHSRYDDRRIAGLIWTLRLLPICAWERATTPLVAQRKPSLAAAASVRWLGAGCMGGAVTLGIARPGLVALLYTLAGIAYAGRVVLHVRLGYCSSSLPAARPLRRLVKLDGVIGSIWIASGIGAILMPNPLVLVVALPLFILAVAVSADTVAMTERLALPRGTDAIFSTVIGAATRDALKPWGSIPLIRVSLTTSCKSRSQLSRWAWWLLLCLFGTALWALSTMVFGWFFGA